MTKMTTEQMTEEFEQRLERLIRIPSEYSTDEPPFGKNIRKALHELLSIAEEDGFTTENVDDFAGHIEFGEGEEIFGILAHLDVVPAGNGWKHSPYALTKKDGKLYGRGTQDDKGPLIAAYMAMKALKQEGFLPKKRVRLIAGTDEEREWKGIDHYFSKKEMPDFGFTPDAVFPVIHAEKGLIDASLNLKTNVSEDESTYIERIEAGDRLNMVPDATEVTIVHKGEQKLTFPSADNVTWNGDRVTIHFSGKAAHGSTPERGENAVLKTMSALEGMDFPESQQRAITWMVEHMKASDGKGMGIPFEDEISGALTMNVGTLHGSMENWKVGINIRYPISYSHDDVVTNLKNLLPASVEYEEVDQMQSLYVPEDHPGVQTLLTSYEKVTGETSEAKAIGGATYARVLENGVAFGAIFPESPDSAHQADECVRVEDMQRAMEIYKSAIYEWTRK
ncbi:dipeptidase PepV [Salimicrobium halophilum]|uniref:Succinyl-diaminopimelate desuccinylase n=1 Tax=Salimicrobium halophilum TaxID=86666 RepID=A0A1G8VKS7_9BACI|nr:dipeptidase PepV [Salimicrobium halophilum]SDJ66691.1 succinyl-diaminopimelate desuccinylase [Salimicrobium halophilum]